MVEITKGNTPMQWKLKYSDESPYDDIEIQCDDRTVAKVPLDDAPVYDYNLIQRNLARYIVDSCNNQNIKVTGSRAEIMPHQSIPHISVISFARALRWHTNGLESWSMSDWFTALAGEVGELGNVIKKMNRERDRMQQRAVVPAQLQEQMKMEIGDVYIYLDLLARRAGLDLEVCIRDTFNRISVREGFPERL
jgi:NTP pyrophosphatase (non-canonical NTP hydrolase)